MDTIMWLLFKIDPVMQVLYIPCDWVLGWTERFGTIWSIVIVGTLTGVGVNLFQKFCSDQKLLGKCKSNMDQLKERMSAAKKAGDDEAAARFGRVCGRISGKYMLKSLLPALWTIPPVVLVVMWAASRLAFQPIR
ncbi:MAG: EMC3/TMCO1 family protein, partial [Phycisphaerae bacterium]|nr:EMC3/TMCO1 family protein [Phycisphaerae bacterium]